MARRERRRRSGTSATTSASAPATPPAATPATTVTATGTEARTAAGATAPPPTGSTRRSAAEVPSPGRWGPLQLLRAAHPRQAVLTALAVAAAAALAGRPARELLLVLGTVLVGQTMVGWHNDLVDRRRDAEDERTGKPVADGRLDPGTVWFALCCAALLVVPLSVSAGVVAGSAYLLALAVSLAGNVVLRAGWLSWLPWAASYALYPAYLSYGGWGGEYRGDPPELAVTALAAGLGVCVHVLRALPGLVADNRAGRKHLALRLALRTGAPRLLWLTLAVTAGVVAALALVASRVGLAQ